MSRAGGVILPAGQEEPDAREIAALINEAVNVRREVIITLHNDTTVVVTSPDRSEIRFRAAMIASVTIR